MKTLKSTYKLALAPLVIALFFSSCSNKMASLSNPNKLVHAQTIEKSKSPQTTANVATVTTPVATTPTDVKTLAENEPQPLVIKKEKTKTGARIKHFTQALAQTFNTETSKIITRQAAAVNQIGAGHHTASYSGANHTQGLLSFAIVCLILGVVFAILGFGGLGALFWTIGIIVLVIALVFFIFYLLGAAAAA